MLYIADKMDGQERRKDPPTFAARAVQALRLLLLSNNKVPIPDRIVPMHRSRRVLQSGAKLSA
jgi:hypothetical protein